MKSFSPVLFACGATAAAVNVKLAGRADNVSTTSYLSRMADTWVGRGITKDYDYATSVLYRGLEQAYEVTQDQALLDFYEGQMSIVGDDGTIDDFDYSFYSLDEYRFAMSALFWYNHTGEEKYKLAADKIRQMINEHPRTPSGGLWHRDPTYPNQMWLDGIFMADSFYVKYTNLFEPDNTTAWDDILLQYDNIEQHCYDDANQLLKHGYDESKTAVWADPESGASPLVWSRAVGWFFVSLTESIEEWPQSHAGYEKLIGYFTDLAEGVLKAQDTTGGWWLIMDDQYVGVDPNYIESSASAMFTYGLLKGVKMGLLDEATYLAPAKKAYEYLAETFVVEADDGFLDWEGTVEVGSLNSDATFEVWLFFFLCLFSPHYLFALHCCCADLFRSTTHPLSYRRTTSRALVRSCGRRTCTRLFEVLARLFQIDKL